MSRGQLAVAIGATVGAIQALEQGADLECWPLRLVRRLLDVLGLDWADIEPRVPSVPARSTEVLGAELARTGEISMAAAAPPDTADGTFGRLREALHGVGMTISVAGGRVTLAPRADVAPLERLRDAGPTGSYARDLTGPERDVVSAICQGRLDLQRLGRSDARALATLRRLGLVEVQDGRAWLAGALAAAIPMSAAGPAPAMSQAAEKVAT